MKFIFDAHLDLSMNALEWNRDLTRPIEEINLREKFLNDKPDRGNATVCLPELKNGNRVRHSRSTHQHRTPFCG